MGRQTDRPPGFAWLVRVPTVAAVAAMLLGLVALAGWLLDSKGLKGVHPGLVAMNPATAVSFVLTAVALALARQEPPRARSRWLVHALAAVVLVVASLRLLDYVVGDVAGVDQILFRQAIERESIPNRMASNTALAFVLIALALLMLHVQTANGRRPTELLSLAAGLVAAVVLSGYLYRVAPLKGVQGQIPMALNTAIGFVLLAVGLLCTHPHRGLLGLGTSQGPTGTTARRLLPAALGIPILIGWICVLGERLGYYGFELGTALMAVSASFLLGAATLWTVHSLGRAEAARSKADEERLRREEELRHANQFLDAVIENIPVSVFLKDTERFAYHRLNRAGETVLGQPRAEVIGKTDDDLFPPEQAERFRRADRQVLQGEECVEVWEQPVETPSGTRWLHTRNVPLRGENDAVRFVLGIGVDVTERKRVEEALRSAKELAEAANRELESFSYAVSHDLRAPLRGIDGFSLALLEDCGERLDEQGRKHLERIRAAACQMGKLIDDLLGLAQVTRTEIHREAVDLSAMAHAVARELQHAEPERRVEWRIMPSVVAEGDPDLLRVVLVNLLGNAWKFTGKQPRAQIEFGRSPDDAQGNYFVRDNGAGFEMDYAAKLFVPFQRLHQAAEFPGTGIGLATVQRIVRRHGGRIWAEGAPGQGATFFFTLRSGEEHNA